jgi:hypothetical protein
VKIVEIYLAILNAGGGRVCGTLFRDVSYLYTIGHKWQRACARACEALKAMIKFLLWCILLVLCWPLALVALILYPLVWLVLLPFRVVGIAVGGALELVSAIIFLPVRLIKAI